MANGTQTVGQCEQRVKKGLLWGHGAASWDDAEKWGVGGGVGIGVGGAEFEEGLLKSLKGLEVSLFRTKEGYKTDIGVFALVPFSGTGAGRFFGLNGRSGLSFAADNGGEDRSNMAATLGLGASIMYPPAEKGASFFAHLSGTYNIGVRHSAPGGFDFAHGPVGLLGVGLAF